MLGLRLIVTVRVSLRVKVRVRVRIMVRVWVWAIATGPKLGLLIPRRHSLLLFLSLCLPRINLCPAETPILPPTVSQPTLTLSQLTLTNSCIELSRSIRVSHPQPHPHLIRLCVNRRCRIGIIKHIVKIGP